jgi:hypothetical protein
MIAMCVVARVFELRGFIACIFEIKLWMDYCGMRRQC